MSKTYTIQRIGSPVRLAPSDGAWEAADRLEIEEFPWYKAGARQATDVALLYDEQALYVLFCCEDRHIYSVETRPNGNVYLDSCVEFFGMPAGTDHYFNFEANCCGTVHLGSGPGRPDRKLASARTHGGIEVRTSIPTPTRDETPRDDGWWLAARLPFAVLAEFMGVAVAPVRGDVWKANFYRCGGKTDDQYACWNPIAWERPDFHRPEFFGTLVFG